MPPASHSRVGLGCSSFSFFFDEAENDEERTNLSPELPKVQGWMETIRYAVVDAGITVLDTAPWYGHGSSEMVIGWAIQKYQLDREKFILNTKVGRYEADPSKQFDFSRDKTLASAKASLERLQVSYIDVLQLHDPEFSPSLDLLLDQSIPALMECKERGWCREIGLTGYPLKVQHQILQMCMERFGRNVFDQAMTYCHFNLHDRTLFQPTLSLGSFFDMTQCLGMRILAAAPLSMGLLTHAGPPAWHPASKALVQACRSAAIKAEKHNVDLATLALKFAISEKRIPCTIVGMKSKDQVRQVCQICKLIEKEDFNVDGIYTREEKIVLDSINDVESGPFSEVWSNGEFEWDGVEEANRFWKLVLDQETTVWQLR